MKNQYKIEKGIPMNNAGEKYPFSQMSKGDSFLIQVKDNINGKIASVRSLIYAKKNSKSITGEFKAKKVENGIRVWKTK